MKISKLFHWLYAILMLLPFAFFVPSVLYYAFNDNATMQSVEVPKNETIAVDFNQSFDNTFRANNGSYVELNNTFIYTGDNQENNKSFTSYNYDKVVGDLYLLKFDYISNQNFSLQAFDRSTSLVSTNVLTSFAYRGFLTDYRYYQISWYNYNQNNSNWSLTLDNVQVFDLTKMFGSGNEPTIEEFNNYFPNSYYPYTQSELMQITYDTGTTEQLVENTSIINYAWESIWDLPLFSWTKITFVSVPFSYLTGIFGLGASNSLNYVFGYFVTISIVWLVFDLLLYVPMLAHNWIDKARIE